MKAKILILLITMSFTVGFNYSFNGSCPLLKNYVKSLPDLINSDHVCNYAGYNMVSPYFYWLIINKDLVQLMNIPLIINIGSGSESSLARIFKPGGPYKIKQKGTRIELEAVESLLRIGHIMYLEQPDIFSFSKEDSIGEYTSEVFLNELRRFLELFVLNNQFFEGARVYIIAEGFMAKIGAMLGLGFLPKITKRWHNISGLIINNGIYDLPIHMRDLGKLSAELHMIPETLIDRLIEETSITGGLVKENPKEAFRRWDFLSNALMRASGLVNFLDDVSDTSDASQDNLIESYLSQKNVQQSLNVQKIGSWKKEPKAPSFTRALPALINSSTAEFNFLFSKPQHVYTLLNVGAYSPLTSVDSVNQWIKTLRSESVNALVNSSRIFVSDDLTTIYAKNNKERLLFAIYPDEGKILGSYSLKTYLKVMDEFIMKNTLKGKEENDALIKDILKGCSNQGKLNTAEEKCICDKNYYGADCSISPRVAKAPEKFALGAMEWKYFFIETKGYTKYSLLQSSNKDCFKRNSLLMVVNLDTNHLPDEYDNDILVTYNELTLNCKQKQNLFILGIRNASPYCDYNITLIEESLEENMTGVLKEIVVGILLGLICSVLVIGIICYILHWSDNKRFSELKI